jgi:hypothetical protein
MADLAPATLHALLNDRGSASEIARTLEALSPEARVAALLDLRGKDVGRLYDAMHEAEPLRVGDVVSADIAEGETVIFEGRNSLALFSRFQKRFARMGSAIVGYNHQSMSFVTGPGLFTLKPASGEGPHPSEIYFDYTALPEGVPSGWPAIRPNDAGFSRLVYMGMHDYMRRICRGAMVGKAYKRGVPEGAYFILCRP